jgi:hypothetical protein
LVIYVTNKKKGLALVLFLKEKTYHFFTKKLDFFGIFKKNVNSVNFALKNERKLAWSKLGFKAMPTSLP